MSGIELVVEDPAWRRHRGLSARLEQAAQAARKAAKLRGGFTILLAGDARLKRLNHDFRGKNKATNVLSFPGSDGYAGDIAIAYGVTKTQAAAAGKAFADHAVHLAVHGVLHLAGHDHETDADARVMEPLEAKILKRLGIADPYAAKAPSPASEATGGGGGRSNAPRQAKLRRVRLAAKPTERRAPSGAKGGTEGAK